jgi:hypothetical protein
MQLLTSSIGKKVLLLLSGFSFLGVAANAHEINYALENAPTGNVFWFYTKLGFEHIVPLGIDHILFVVCLCLLNTKLKAVIWQATAFTVAHSITLALSIQNIITLPGSIVEPIIALSILFVAVENLVIRELKPWRVALVFLFGLIHGLGFASVLNEIGLPRDQFALSLISFNVGVELGQLLVIAVVCTILHLFEKRTWYRQRIVYPASLLIIFIASYWTIQRIIEV